MANSSGDDILTLSIASSIGDESDVQDSVNLTWKQLKTFWKSSSPKAKKLLKELMLSDEERLDNIGDFMSHSEKVNKGNLPGNVTWTNMFYEANPSFPLENTLPTVSNLKNLPDCSSTLVNAKYSNDTNNSSHAIRSLPIDTIKSAHTLVHENIAFPCEIGMKTSVLLSSEKKQSNRNAPAEVDSIQTKNDTEEYISSEDIDDGISSHKKEILTDFQESQNSTSIKELTACIRRLVSSLEIMTQQNEPPDYKTCNGSPNKSHRQTLFAPNSNIHQDVPSCSKYSHSCGSTERNNLPCYDSTVEKKHCHFRCQCCHNRCNLVQCTFQSNCCHCELFSSKTVPECSFSCSKLYSEGNSEDTISPSIVIPLQNINEDALLKLVTVLKSDSKFC